MRFPERCVYKLCICICRSPKYLHWNKYPHPYTSSAHSHNTPNFTWFCISCWLSYKNIPVVHYIFFLLLGRKGNVFFFFTRGAMKNLHRASSPVRRTRDEARGEEKSLEHTGRLPKVRPSREGFVFSRKRHDRLELRRQDNLHENRSKAAGFL